MSDEAKLTGLSAGNCGLCGQPFPDGRFYFTPGKASICPACFSALERGKASAMPGAMSDEAKRMTGEELAAAKALADEATPGPWYTVDSPWGDSTWVNALSEDPHGGVFVCDCKSSTAEYDDLGDNEDLYRPENNAAFIAAARQLVPALLAHIAAVEAENAALREALLGYAEAFHREIHPGETAYELRVSPGVRDAAITVLMPLFKRPPTAADLRRERDRTHG
jgi:hypothetical protein